MEQRQLLLVGIDELKNKGPKGKTFAHKNQKKNFLKNSIVLLDSQIQTELVREHQEFRDTFVPPFKYRHICSYP